MTELPNLRANFTAVCRMANNGELETFLAVLHDELAIRCPRASRLVGNALDAMIEQRERYHGRRKQSPNVLIAGCGDDALEQLPPPHGDDGLPA
jgi:hypothetical protein